MAWLLVLVAIFVLLISSTLLSVSNNYTAARKIGAPIIISPFSYKNPFWLLAGRSVAEVFRYLPRPFSSWAKLLYIGWVWDDNGAIHRELGPIITHVGPGTLEVLVADPEAARDFLARRKDFVKQPNMQRPLDVFGSNVLTTNGENWQRHRKLTAPCFNERASSIVWEETLKQADAALELWKNADKKQGTEETANYTQEIALNVLTRVGFGTQNSFRSSEILPAGYKIPFRIALHTVLFHLLILFIIPLKVLTLPIMPPSWQRAGNSYIETRKRMEEAFRNEQNSIVERSSGGEVNSSNNNLLNALIRASESEKPAQRLTKSEILGNVFIFNVAGHDTTANTLAYAIFLLAAHPEWQGWLSEEISAVVGDGEAMDYEKAFPKLQRCLYTMYETLRLYGAVVWLPRYTETPQTLTTKTRSYSIPADTMVSLNLHGLHVNRDVWGPDVLTWRPGRWLGSSSTSTPAPGQGPLDDLIPQQAIRDGSYIAWSDGPRVCPGKKFAQVEFVAVMATLFRGHRVRPVLRAGETKADGEARINAMLQSSGIYGVSLKMFSPKDVKLVWEEVER